MFIFTFFLKASSVLQFMTLTGSLLHGVAAAFQSICYHTSHHVNVVWLAMLWSHTSGFLYDDKQQVPLNTE